MAGQDDMKKAQKQEIVDTILGLHAKEKQAKADAPSGATPKKFFTAKWLVRQFPNWASEEVKSSNRRSKSKSTKTANPELKLYVQYLSAGEYNRFTRMMFNTLEAASHAAEVLVDKINSSPAGKDGALVLNYNGSKVQLTRNRKVRIRNLVDNLRNRIYSYLRAKMRVIHSPSANGYAGSLNVFELYANTAKVLKSKLVLPSKKPIVLSKTLKSGLLYRDSISSILWTYSNQIKSDHDEKHPLDEDVLKRVSKSVSDASSLSELAKISRRYGGKTFNIDNTIFQEILRLKVNAATHVGGKETKRSVVDHINARRKHKAKGGSWTEVSDTRSTSTDVSSIIGLMGVRVSGDGVSTKDLKADHRHLKAANKAWGATLSGRREDIKKIKVMVEKRANAIKKGKSSGKSTGRRGKSSGRRG